MTAPLENVESLTEEERAFLQRRVATFGLLGGSLMSAFLVYRSVEIIAYGLPERFGSPDMWLHALASVCFVAVWLICRRGALPAKLVRIVETVGLVTGCAALELMGAAIPLSARPDFIVLLALTYSLVVRSIVVPSTASRTVALGAAIGVPQLVSVYRIGLTVDLEIWSQFSPLFGEMTPQTFAVAGVISSAAWWICSVAVAAAASSVIYGLRREVREAQQLGQYCLEYKLGSGGMGEVYRARHALLRRAAAIKLIRADRDSGGRVQQRFEREAQVTANLKSPHTVGLYDFGVSADGTFYYVMELLDGIDLSTAVGQFGPMPPARVVYLLRQACESLEEAHAAGLVHRDIKPANLFLCQQGIRYDFIKVLDFGLVALEPDPNETDQGLTANGFVGGTPAYVAPEAIDGRAVDGRADIYALGCVAYWLLTGRAVFEGRTAMATLVAHIGETPTPPSQVSEVDVPAALEAVVMACLEKDPEDRPRSMEALRSSLAIDRLLAEWTQERARRWWESHRPKRASQGEPVDVSPTVLIAKR